MGPLKSKVRPFGSFSRCFWISTSTVKWIYVSSFRVATGVSWTGFKSIPFRSGDGEKGEYEWKGQSRKHDVKSRCWALPLTLTVMYGSMHCPASFRPIFSIVSVSKVIPGSEGNRGNRVPVKDVKLSLKPWPKNVLTNEVLFAYWQTKWINWLFLKVSQEVVYE